MRILHVKVERSDGWFCAHGLEEPGVITQGRTLDELVYMVRDAAQLMLEEKEIHIELILPADVEVGAHGRKSRGQRKRVA